MTLIICLHSCTGDHVRRDQSQNGVSQLLQDHLGRQLLHKCAECETGGDQGVVLFDLVAGIYEAAVVALGR